MKTELGFVACVGALVGCFSDPPPVGGDTDADTETSTSNGPTSSGTSPTSTSPTASATGTSSTSATTTDSTSEPGESESSGGIPGCQDDACLVDIVVIVDNSGTMAIEQQYVGVAMLGLEARLRASGYDAHVMFTTTDFGNPVCTAFQPDGYTPAQGAPTTTACTERLDDFTGLGSDPDVVPEACTSACPSPIAPMDDPYVAFGPGGSNVPAAPDVDVDGDGSLDSPAAQALACLAPQGINGCGYESQLEAIVGALDPGSPWNAGADPFLRAGSTVAVVIVTDEADCSMQDYGAMTDEQYMETNPDTASPQASSAICWNAGVTCTGGPGNYDDCTSRDATPLHPITRYTDFLSSALTGHEVVMLGVLGIPTVNAHLEESPFIPTGGGVTSLEYRDWIDGEYPAGDMLPEDIANGVTADHKDFLFGIGPGCTGGDALAGFTGQAIPPVRVREVCESLDVGNDPTDRRCCLESVCDGDYSAAMRCLVGLVDNTFQ